MILAFHPESMTLSMGFLCPASVLPQHYTLAKGVCQATKPFFSGVPAPAGAFSLRLFALIVLRASGTMIAVARNSGDRNY